jgi:hypothetical protein
MAFDKTWDQEDAWWRENFTARPYASGRTYEDFQPAYKYGFESGQHHMGRGWGDVETDLQTGWDRLEGRGGAESTWNKVKDAVRDAWNRVTGQSELEPSKMNEREVERLSHGGRPKK